MSALASHLTVAALGVALGLAIANYQWVKAQNRRRTKSDAGGES